jgi:hypothetical protein
VQVNFTELKMIHMEQRKRLKVQVNFMDFIIIRNVTDGARSKTENVNKHGSLLMYQIS